MENAPAHGVFVWNELNTHDLAAAKAFYAATLGWRFETMPVEGHDDYCIIMMGETRVGGIFMLAGAQFECVPDDWLAYVAVDDVDARIAAVEAKGGTVLRAPFEVPDVGRIAIVRDSGGAVAGWITPRM
ncbi:Glyoxalase/bleomycin resistance protein/dioxygenase [Ancylobacter novellus DSM 506]|uniref:Glyoxalase/bleomycin resistance protein/dioxygenase n=1 Tax=Ancylobacter novellus (strain ATCC 8093 / DSM 506 / JCM 20403 / CCM 1077 / IAM 12100 / NBRC 12443 / NCIMB 10456) TaxID=639283 RepID=D7A0H8_ANCN5|nr:VOC family protein [Ancylobacter novellus]ADH91299.1 Glyoxalase/bleomycin resistance protein/dioxygenase [Ancylobacter novellus DSM 506]